MAIPQAVNDALTLYVGSVNAATPLAAATRITIGALLKAGGTLISQIDGAITTAAGALDSADPIGFSGDMVTALNALATASEDQADLVNMRGLVGRAVFNLGQVQGAA